MAEKYQDSDKKPSKHGDLLETARKRFDIAVEAEKKLREVGLEDLKFRAGEQWPEEILRERDFDDRPCLVINRIPQFVRQITNDQRQNRPAVKVYPVDDLADVETAKVYQGLIRHIEYNSGAEAAYDTAFEGAATKGFGYWRICTDYVDPMSFEQEILIKRIRDHFSVYLDPNAKEPDGSDANWGFVFEDMPKEEYEAEYGDSELAGMESWDDLASKRPGWVERSTCRVAEYFCKEFEEKEIALLADGTTIELDELNKLFPDGDMPPEKQVVTTRESKIPRIKWYKINGIEVLEKTDWPGRWIPIVPVYGDEMEIEGEIIRESVVRHAKDSQRMYNYWASTETETIALAPRAPFIVAEGQIPREYENQWRTANKKSHAYLTYKPTTHSGQLAPPPQRNLFEPPVQGITNARLQAAEDLKATTGIYDAALGNRSNETSGVAIQSRNLQAQTSNFHLIDNLTRSIRHTGRILVDLIPRIYDTPRAARIIGEEGEQEIIRIHEVFIYRGEETIFRLGHGKYDVVIDTGPSFATKRQEAAATIESLVRAYPALMQVAGDLMVKNMDWPGAQEIAERIKKTLPPGLAEDSNQKPLPPEVQAQIQSMNQMIEQLTEKLNEANKTIDEKRIELESEERIEFAKMETELEKEKMKIANNYALESVNQQLADLDAYVRRLSQNSSLNVSPDQSGAQFDQPTGGQSPGTLPMGEF